MEDPKIEDLDLYEILEIETTSTVADIKKAYRKKALQCHPDKNPDNPNAAKEFHQLSRILEVLIDATARKAYDAVLKGRKEAAIRHKELDSKRRKLKEDLEARERRAAANYKTKSADEKLKEEIERLRKEGSKQVEEELERIRQEVLEEQKAQLDANKCSGANYRIKIKWNVAKDDTTNGGYSHENLHRFLSKYGNVTALVLSQKRMGTALVEFEARNAAEMAVEMEVGLPSNPLKLEWVNPPPARKGAASSLVKPSDYESVVLTKMRQAEERRRLIEQLKAEDGDD
ncbi:dnaJ homolog subfamily C member 17 [Tribolium castaneum]|uniref:DnaJ homolog subfamily C member 17-like Protein n=1 Tax=Tribolium castaneum TaxID=7070 RepID=D6WH30_TRICA|nr:PREDICTED: dnaJ homolog subfamily C member 17 [Tribolium castaneum]EFA00119.1 DnaJ homolog subfamily C member 17-like Protein [Tribolium castaneum]|eukprot:XP_974891.1 PREDICTED: dnaJ homolog subfamily C member 17 [Tribolium castaneum]